VAFLRLTWSGPARSLARTAETLHQKFNRIPEQPHDPHSTGSLVEADMWVRNPPEVWPYVEGKVRGISLAPLYKGAPKAALRDPRFYGVLALCDAIRGGRTRERNLAIELLGKEINA